MPSINMIAARRAEKKKLEENVRIAVLLVLGSVLIALVILSFMTARVFNTTREIQAIDDELLRVQPIVEKIQNYESEIKILTPKLTLLTDSKKKTLQWYDIMSYLSRNMADKTWFTALNTSQKPDPIVEQDQKPGTSTWLALTGISANQTLVGETMLRLNQIPLFSNVVLEFTQTAAKKDIPTVDFSISVQLTKTGKAEEEVPDNVSN